MLGRDRLTIVLWVMAGTSAVGAVILTGRPEHIAIVTGVAALVACGKRRRCLEHRRARRQRRADATVMSSAGYLRERYECLAERLDRLERRVSGMRRTMDAAHQDLDIPGDETTGSLPKLHAVHDEAG